MNIRMKRGMALVLMASLLLAGSAQALFGLGKSKPEALSPENGPTARDLEIRTYRGIPYLGQLEAADPDGAFLMNEARYSRLTREFPDRAETLFKRNEEVAMDRYQHLLKLKAMYDEK